MSVELKLSSPWAEVKEKLKEINHLLTDDDLAYTPGQESELLERLSRKLCRSMKEIKAWVESVSSNEGKAS